MTKLIKIAVDAMGGDNSPRKVIDGIIHNHKKNKENFYKIYGNKDEISKHLDNKINKKMKVYINLFHSMVSEIHFWDDLNREKKSEKLSIFLEDFKNIDEFVDYFEVFSEELSKKNLNYLIKGVINT